MEAKRLGFDCGNRALGLNFAKWTKDPAHYVGGPLGTPLLLTAAINVWCAAQPSLLVPTTVVTKSLIPTRWEMLLVWIAANRLRGYETQPHQPNVTQTKS
jgi:hypothetical protein